MNYQLAVELNTLGSLSLQSGDLPRSLDMFRDALKYTICDVSSAECSKKLSLPHHSIPMSPYSAIGRNSGTSDRPHVASTNAPPSLSLPFVFCQAIEVRPEPGAYATDPLVNSTIVSSVIIFNIAVVYHLRALETSLESTRRLAVAMTFYQKCQLLLQQSIEVRCSTRNPTVDLLLLAQYNNMAHVAFEMGSYAISRKYFALLIHFSLNPLAYDDPSYAMMVEQHRTNFLLNAIILRDPISAAAA